MEMTSFKLVLVLALALPSIAGLAADESKDKAARVAREQARRVQQQVKALETEKGALAADKAKLEAELKEAQARADASSRQLAGAERARADLARARADLTRTLETMKVEAAALMARIADEERKRTEIERKMLETERRHAEQRQAFELEKRRMEGISTQQLAALAASRERNERMYRLGFELIDRYENKGVWTSALQAEPFTGLKRAQIEKMAEEDRDKFDKERLPLAN